MALLKKCIFLLCFLGMAFHIFGSVPVPFSGKLAINGENFHGHALFSFSIIDQYGKVHWSHAEDTDAMIENFVRNGRYLVLLGGQGMQALPADLFLQHESLFLRVFVDLKDGKGMRLLEPDQRITSSPYALSAEIARLAERAQVAGRVDAGAITADMLEQRLLEDLNRTSELGEITREMLPQDVRDDLNRTVRLQDLSDEVSQSINRPITREMLPQGVRDELNATITRDRLSADVRADLNRTIGITNLSSEVTDKLNQTFSIDAGSITLDQLSQQVRDDINRTITRDRLSSDVLSDINRTITTNQLSEQILKYLKPEITQQPSTENIFTYNNHTLSVNAEGKYLTYQWKKNGANLEGETNATLTIIDANATQHDGNYSVVVSNDFGSIETTEAELKVYPWNIMAVQGVEMWLDSNDSSSIELNEEKVISWNDKSGNENNASQLSDSLRPSYGQDDNGSYVVFTSSSTSSSAGEAVDADNYLILSGIEGKSLFFVIDYDGSPTSFLFGSQLSAGSYIFIGASSYAISLDGAIGDRGSWWYNSDFVATGGNIGEANQISIDSTTLHVINYSNGYPSYKFTRLGSYVDNKGGFGGKVREIISFNSYVKTADLQRIEGYLAHKWGLTANLSSDHPFKNSAP